MAKKAPRKRRRRREALVHGPRGRLPIAIRLRAHVKNRHGQSWDRFSIDLTVKDEHLREIEALMLRIASPPGAKQRGKLAKSRDMRRRIAAAIRLLSEAASSPPLSRKSRSVSPLPSGFPVLGVGAVAEWAVLSSTARAYLASMAVQERSALNIPPRLARGQLYAKHNHNDDLSSDFGRGRWDSRPDRQGRR